MIIVRSDAPTLFDCLEAISHDAGAGAGHSNYTLPDEVAEDLQSYEAALAALTPEQRTTFSIGDYDDARIIANSPILQKLDKILEEFFEGDMG